MKRELVVGLSLIAGAAGASGPLGHTTMARATVSEILAGRIQAPAELKALLKNPEMVRAYLGGSIGPDIEESSHYGKTGDFAGKLLADARNDLAIAKKSGNATKIAAASEEVAFAFGWLNHCAADLSIHPVINAMTGDTYRYNGAAGKALHAETEGEFTAFLSHGKPLPPYDPKIPIDFLAREAGLTTNSITSGVRTLDLKAAAERKFAEGAGASSNFEGAFQLIESNAMAYNRSFLRDRTTLKNWDLDCGKITTEDFESLRKATLEANGGKLPSNWGAMYLQWNDRTTGLTYAKKVTVMAAILAGAGTPDRPEDRPKADLTVPKGGAWFLERTEFRVDYANDADLRAKYDPKEEGADGYGSAQAKFGHPDPNIFVTVRVKVAWTMPERKLIPGKSYKIRFAIFDAGSDDRHGLFLGASGGFGANCPSMRNVWAGPTASISLDQNRLKGEDTKEFTAYGASDGTEMFLEASWNVGVRAAHFVYVYKFRAK